MNTLIKLQENIIANNDFPKVIFKKKMTLTLNRTLVQGNYYRRKRLVTSSTRKTRLVTHSTCLTTRSTLSTRLSTRSTPSSTRSTRLSTRSTPSSTRSTRFSTRSTRLSIRLSIRSARLSTRSVCLSTRSTICRSFYNWSKYDSNSLKCPASWRYWVSIRMFLTLH